jgi:TPR repeat protein
MRELGNLYFDGSKVAHDIHEANRWMARAAANGDAQAVKWIEENCPKRPKWLQDILINHDSY